MHVSQCNLTRIKVQTETRKNCIFFCRKKLYVACETIHNRVNKKIENAQIVGILNYTLSYQLVISHPIAEKIEAKAESETPKRVKLLTRSNRCQSKS